MRNFMYDAHYVIIRDVSTLLLIIYDVIMVISRYHMSSRYLFENNVHSIISFCMKIITACYVWGGLCTDINRGSFPSVLPRLRVIVINFPLFQTNFVNSCLAFELWVTLHHYSRECNMRE